MKINAEYALTNPIEYGTIRIMRRDFWNTTIEC